MAAAYSLVPSTMKRLPTGGLTFVAAHIFPVALEHIFITHGFKNLTTHNFPTGVNSPQNGFLLTDSMHKFWDDYSLAVNPHNGFKVQAFQPNAWIYQGSIVYSVCRQPDNPISVIPALLRWHYEQAVLCNMRGSGEPSFEFEFPPGTDMMGEIREGPYAAERMEAELYNRLYGLDVYWPCNGTHQHLPLPREIYRGKAE